MLLFICPNSSINPMTHTVANGIIGNQVRVFVDLVRFDHGEIVIDQSRRHILFFYCLYNIVQIIVVYE